MTMMANKIVCCEKCFEYVAKQSTNAARLWLDLCALWYTKGQVLTVRTHDFPELRTLEQMNFLMSTDQPQHILIKIFGLQKDHLDGIDYFCVGKDHE